MGQPAKADEEHSVRAAYERQQVASTYVEQRFQLAWSRLLHEKQVSAVQAALDRYKPSRVLELAPGPARMAVHLVLDHRATMLDASDAMLHQAEAHLRAAGKLDEWELLKGNAFELGHTQRQWDFIYTFRLIRHFHTADRTRLYRAIQAALSPGGLLMMDVVNETVRAGLDARQRTPPADELRIHDATYTAGEFNEELERHGFIVLRMVPVIRHFALQSWISYRLDHRIGRLASWAVRRLERLPSTHPLEWVALCQKTTGRTEA